MSALRNFAWLATVDEEVEIVQRRVESIGRSLELPAEPPGG